MGEGSKTIAEDNLSYRSSIMPRPNWWSRQRGSPDGSALPARLTTLQPALALV